MLRRTVRAFFSSGRLEEASAFFRRLLKGLYGEFREADPLTDYQHMGARRHPSRLPASSTYCLSAIGFGVREGARLSIVMHAKNGFAWSPKPGRKLQKSRAS